MTAFIIFLSIYFTQLYLLCFFYMPLVLYRIYNENTIKRKKSKWNNERKLLGADQGSNLWLICQEIWWLSTFDWQENFQTWITFLPAPFFDTLKALKWPHELSLCRNQFFPKKVCGKMNYVGFYGFFHTNCWSNRDYGLRLAYQNQQKSGLFVIISSK